MDISRHDSVSGPPITSHEHERLLCTLGQAAMEVDSPEPFRFECILGSPFAWVIHPGLDLGAVIAAYAHLLFLDRLGYIRLRFDDCAQTGTLNLAPAGFARCAELEMLQA